MVRNHPQLKWHPCSCTDNSRGSLTPTSRAWITSGICVAWKTSGLPPQLDHSQGINHTDHAAQRGLSWGCSEHPFHKAGPPTGPLHSCWFCMLNFASWEQNKKASRSVCSYTKDICCTTWISPNDGHWILHQNNTCGQIPLEDTSHFWKEGSWSYFFLLKIDCSFSFPLPTKVPNQVSVITIPSPFYSKEFFLA